MTNIPIAVIARVAAHRAFSGAGLAEREVLCIDTPFGASNPVHVFEATGQQFVVLSRHGETGYEVSAPFVNDRANLWALRSIGVQKIVSWSAPGAIDPRIEPGRLIVPDDVLDLAGAPVTYFAGAGQGVIRSRPAFCPELRAAVLSTLRSRPVRDGGVYASTTGPRFETPAEIRALAALGASLVGMTMTPELWLARELEICYVAVCYSVNYAEGVLDRPGTSATEGGARPFDPTRKFEGLTSEAELERINKMEDEFPSIILELLPAVAATRRSCPCPQLLSRYRARAELAEDWWRSL